MKTLHELFKELEVYWSDDFYDKMAENWDDCHDAVFVYNTETEKARFGQMPKDNWYYIKGDILLARMHKPTEMNYETTDLFTEEEMEIIYDKYDGFWSDYVKFHPEYSIEERVENASRSYLENNWNAFYNEMEEKLMEAQKEVDNEKD
jgi:hypothetical protein